MNFIIALLCVCGAVVISGYSIIDQEIRLRQLLVSDFRGVVPTLDPLHIDSFNLNNTLRNESHFIAHDATISGLAKFDQININKLYNNGSFVFQIHVPSIKLESKLEILLETNDIPDVSALSKYKSDKFSVSINNINVTVTGILDRFAGKMSDISVDVQFSQNLTNIEIEDSIADNVNLWSSEELIRDFEDAIHHYQKQFCKFLCDYNNKLIEYEP